MAEPSKSVLEIFTDIARLSSQKLAMEIGEQTWTYGELLHQSVGVADCLPIHRGEVIFQYVDASLEMICGLLGILYAGGVLCSLSPNDSSTHLRQLIEDMDGRYVLVHSNTLKNFSALAEREIALINLELVLLENSTRKIAERSQISPFGSNPSKELRLFFLQTST